MFSDLLHVKSRTADTRLRARNQEGLTQITEEWMHAYRSRLKAWNP